LMLVTLFFSLFVLSQATSICDKYSKALDLTNNKLISTIISSTVTKLVAVGAITKQYFDGVKPAGSTNFLNSPDELKALEASLVQFFGGGLGCSDGSITPYTGPSMSRVHQKMGIDFAAFSYFNDQVISVLASAGVSSTDQVAVRGVLNSFKTDVVSQTICDRYSAALKITNKQLVKSVVVGTFTAATASTSPILIYFNGVKPPGSTDFLNRNKDALPGLVQGLTTFFGAALGCTDGTIPPYTGPNIGKLHKPMGIDGSDFNFFNLQLLTVMRKAGVAMADLRTVDSVLNSTRTQIVSAR